MPCGAPRSSCRCRRTPTSGQDRCSAVPRVAFARVQEDRPLLPGIVERPLKGLDVRHHPEATLCVRVGERIGACGGRRTRRRGATGGELQQCLGRFGRQVIGDVEQRILRRRPHVAQPLDRHAVTQQVVVRRTGEDRGPRRLSRARYCGYVRCRHVHVDVPRHLDLTHRLADLHELRRPGRRMPLQPPPLGPLIRRVVMVHVAEQEARRGPVDDQTDVATNADGPEVLVLRPLDLVQFQPRMRRVHLQVERGRLDGLLLVAGQLREAVGEGVGDAELHQVSISTGTPIWFATSVRRSTATSGALTLTISAYRAAWLYRSRA